MAILLPALLDEIVAGKKTIECRLGRENYIPKGSVQAGDLLWLKDSSGPIRGIASVKKVRTVRLHSPQVLKDICKKWNHKILAPRDFWQSHRKAEMATLIFLGETCALRPFRIIKKDRRAWVPLAQPPVPGKPLKTYKLPRPCN